MKNSQETFTKQDIEYLQHCLVLAEEVLNAGDEPFGSILA